MGKFNIGDKVTYIGEMEMNLSQRDLPLQLKLSKGVNLTVEEALKTDTGGYILRFKEVVPWLPEALFTK